LGVAGPASAPEGTIALLFTDIEGSTRLATELGTAWPDVLETHHELIADAIAQENGFVEGTEGDAFFATFVDPTAAARAAVAAHRRLRSHPWPPAVGELRVRMGLHVGYVERGATGYVGLEVHRAARVGAAAHGGQLLMTAAAHELIGDRVATDPLGAHRLKDFPAPELLFCAVIDGRGAAHFPPPRTQPVRPTNLPAGTPSLLGRGSEIERVRTALLVDRERMVTLTGRGGAGKTSLALAAAGDLLDDYPGGVWLTGLATTATADDVLPAVAAAVNAKGEFEDSTLEAIASRLTGRGRTLLVLDNFEHLLSAAPSLVALLEATADVQLLITSQAPLRVGPERCLAVDALDEQAAVALIERVARQRTGWVSTSDQERAALSEVAAMLDGLPLALELAAARLTLLTPTQLLERLRSSFDVLLDDRRDRPDRHRSLRATVDWTLGLLDTPARTLFHRMGAFAGPVELDEIESVAGADGLEVLDALAALIDVALVVRVESGDNRVRFALPEALRQIAAGMLDGEDDGHRWRSEHARRQHELLVAAHDLFVSGPVYRAALAADAEAALALQWARATDDPRADQLAASRAMLLADTGNVREALSVLAPLLESPPDDPQIRGQAQMAYARALSLLGRMDEACAAVDAAVGLVTEPSTLALALLQRGVDRMRARQVPGALADHERATAMAREVGPAALACALLYESQTRMEAGELERAASLLAEAERVGRPVDAARLWYQHTVTGDMALLSGRSAEAVGQYALALEVAEQQGNQLQMCWDLCGLADAMALNQDDAEALEVAGMAEQQIAEVGGTSTGTLWHLRDRDIVAEAQERVGAAAAEDLKARGRAVTAGYRVTRACSLARGRQQATT
jgi:predicted ATPase/class 3 adenylate cyclase